MDYEYERGTNRAIVVPSKRGNMRLPHDYLVDGEALTKEEFEDREAR